MRLTVESGPLAGTTVPLDRAEPTYLGSGPDCAVRIQEAGVQAQHAVVKALKDQGFGLKALHPGVRVNGAAVEATPLRDGDVIEIGTTRVAFGQVQSRGLPKITGYRILDELGRGGMGMVYRAEQTSLHRQVALKVLNQDLTKDPAFVSKFVAEARAAAKLQHPNVVQVFDVEHDGGTYYYAMELMQEGSLEDWLKQNGAMPVERTLRVVADAARGLAYAESLGIVHRDIKPDNLMLDQHGAVKIADLGLAGSGEETEEKAIGTPHFMAPEQVLKKPLDHRTDLYALGCTFYRLLTGRTPFRGQTVKDILRAQVKDDAEPAHKVNPQVPVEVSALVQKLMAKEPGNRFQTANDLLEQLDVLLQPPAKKGLWIGLAAAGVLVAGGAVYWAVTKPKEIVEVEKRYDDPEKQQFADELKVLRKARKEDAATIALLQVRLQNQPERDQAASLDRLAAEHAGTPAAAEATERAMALRAAAQAREQELAALRGRIDTQLAALRQGLQVQLDAHDYALAMGSLAVEAPPGAADDPHWRTGIAELQAMVKTAAEQTLAGLDAQLAKARGSGDAETLRRAIQTVTDAIAKPTAWPESMRPALEARKQALQEASSNLVALQKEHSDSLWLQYRAIVVGEAGVLAALRRQDYTAAAAAATTFADGAGADPAAAAGRTLVAVLQRGGVFAEALEKAAQAGGLTHRLADGSSLTVLRWDRAARTLVLGDPARKPVKEQPLPTTSLQPEQWAELAEQVAPPSPGARECFLGLVAVLAHADAARPYLARLDAKDDASGTGEQAYPLGSNLLDQLQRRLPEGNDEAWVVTLRSDLQAAQRLASGLRALSERRNLAAAGHLDRLLADFPHSLVVMALP